MKHMIEWSSRSKKDYFKLLDYLQEEWGHAVVKKFNTRINEVLSIIAEKPHLFPLSYGH